MTGFDEILGQKLPIDLLRRMLATNRIPHAQLFQGPAAVGKGTTALAFARALLCGEETEGCGHCSSCHLVETGGHPDLLQVGRLAKESAPAKSRKAAPRDVPSTDLRKLIVVEQIREVVRVAGFAPRHGDRRVFLVDPADHMNSESQNILLKTLEEPGRGAVLILVASRPHLLLPTVRSRCFGLRFSAMPADELAGILERRGIDHDQALSRASLAGGRPGRALGVDLDALHERREELLTALESLAGSTAGLADLPAHAARLAGKEESILLEGLDLLEGLLRDAARAAVSPSEPALLNADLAGRLQTLGQRLGAQHAARLVQTVQTLRGDLRFNVNRTLVAEAILAAAAGASPPRPR